MDSKEKIFKKLADSRSLNKAYLFFGDEGVGKLSFASALANFLDGGEFKKPEKEKFFLDAFFFYPDEKGTIGVDAVREIRRFLSRTPVRSDYKVAVVTDSSTLTPQAQSALLKIVEEPPRFSLMIFLSRDTNVFLPPLLSRMTKVYFSRMPKKEIRRILAEQYGVQGDKAQMIAEESFGRIGRALELAGIVPGKSSKKDLSGRIEEAVLSLRKRNLIRFSPIISKLLEKQALLGRYNLNEKLQEKTVQRFIN